MADSSIVERLRDEFAAYFDSLEELPLCPSVTPVEIRAWLDAQFDFSAPVAPEILFDEVAAKLRKWSQSSNHPRHFGLFRPAIEPSAVIAAALVAMHNPQLAYWKAAPAAFEIERHVLRTVTSLLGLDDASTHAHFCNGGSEANHSAVILALTRAFPAFAGDGLQGLTERPVFYASAERHHSLDKIATMTGLGRDALRLVPVDTGLRIDTGALRDMIAADRAQGLAPFLVASTAGTTNAGVIDPLNEIADVCASEELWHHVDAAWGGAAAFSPRLRHVLDGIARADSITLDAHKWLSMPAGAGMLFCAHCELMARTFRTDAAYVPKPGDGTPPDNFLTSMPWGRRMIGLPLFFSLAERGLAGLADRVDAMATLGERLREGLRSRGWSVVNDTPLPVVCFTHTTLDDDALAGIVTALQREGIAWISTTRLNRAGLVLRACITNYCSECRHVNDLLDNLDRLVRDRD